MPSQQLSFRQYQNGIDLLTCSKTSSSFAGEPTDGLLLSAGEFLVESSEAQHCTGKTLPYLFHSADILWREAIKRLGFAENDEWFGDLAEYFRPEEDCKVGLQVVGTLTRQ